MSHLILAPQPTVHFDPVLSILNTLGTFMSITSNPGLDDWIIDTLDQMPEEQQQRFNVIFIGFGIEGILSLHEDGIDTFPDFLLHLAKMDATTMRDTLLHHQVYSIHRRVLVENMIPMRDNADGLLDSEKAFLNYTKELFTGKLDELTPEELKQDKRIHQQAYRLLINPPAMKDVLLQHLSYCWDEFMRDEWAQVQPELINATHALQQIPLQGMDIFEAMDVIIGRDLRSVFIHSELAKLREIRFIPVKHNGPYISWFGKNDVLYLFFVPRAVDPALDPNQILNRLKALGDDTRLDILLAIKAAGEMTTGEIMEEFDLNKSAVSRHLRMLFANDFIRERLEADGKSKSYQLNQTRTQDLLHALARLLLE